MSQLMHNQAAPRREGSGEDPCSHHGGQEAARGGRSRGGRCTFWATPRDLSFLPAPPPIQPLNPSKMNHG